MRWALLGLVGCTKLLGVHDFSPPDATDVDAAVAVDAPPEAPPPDADTLGMGLLAHLTFDSDPIGADITGHGHDGTCSGQCQSIAGELGKGVDFNGSSTMTLAGVFPTTPFSITLWIQPGSLPTNTPSCAFSREAGNATGYALCFTKTGPEIVFASGAEKFAMPTTGYHHYGLTWDGTTARTYLDGAQVDAHTVDLAPANSKFFVGFEGRANPFTGSLDDLRYYDRALSVAELQGLTGGSQ